MQLKTVSLPYRGMQIYQDRDSQGISIAAQILVDRAVEAIDNLPIRVLELGTGCGIVSIMCALARPKWQISAIDIQPDLVELARQNVSACGLQIDVHQQDLRKLEGNYDLIISNPPWRKLGSGMMSNYPSRNLSRFELTCDMEDVLRAIKRLLAPKALAILLYPTERDKELAEGAEKSFLDIIKQKQENGIKAYTTSYIQNRKGNEDEIFPDYRATDHVIWSMGISGTRSRSK